ncbi:LuxR C-terminal-related transcriptional regulator [Oricola sp.]|uniref:helix-turn-helix transcriptional regulator n=1 Tax=Oricola sp. TaxID=1979950 RepID=UPI0025E426EB|nr:LuxR C-terminal-related transcriptional regulator [Oricola sp.]MCI5074224.1 LuxR family transcriptional regulator [Oricola sp.]
MYRVLVAPDFVIAPSNPDFPPAILEAMKIARDQTQSNYISFWARLEGNGLASNIIVTTYPAHWLERYTERNYAHIDPVIVKGLDSVGAVIFDHRHPEHAGLTEMAEGAIEFDIGLYTVGIPIHISPGIHSVTTFATDVDVTGATDEAAGLMAKFREHAHIIALTVTERFLKNDPPKVALSDREIEVLYWGAQGKTDKEIGETMKLSRWTIVAHMQSAKSKLHVANKPAAIARAIELNLFSRYEHKL